jgi:hypothetical protein
MLPLRWMQGLAELGGNAMSHNLLDATEGDFDDDGFDDVLSLSPTKIRIAWNGPEGLKNFEVVQEASGEWRGMAWDPSAKTLWLQCAFPDRLECWHFEGQTLDFDHSFSGASRSIRVCPDRGLVSLQRKGNELELLTAQGESIVLIPDASSLSDAALIPSRKPGDPDILVLQDKFTGQLGTAVGSADRWSEVSWWNESGSTLTWHIRMTEREGFQVLGNSDKNLWFKEIDASGAVSNAWKPSHRECHDCDHWLIPNDDPNVIEVVVRSHVVFTTSHLLLDARDGRETSRFILAELDQAPTLVMPDLDGDGTADIMYPLHDGHQWAYHVPWKTGTRRVFWNAPGIQTDRWNLPFDIPKPWLDAVGDPSRIQEIWTHQGELLVHKTDGWYAIETLDSLRSSNAVPSDPKPDGPYCHQLLISYLDLGLLSGQDDYTGIAEIKPHQWHHIVYIRKADLRTEVWLDGQCLFRGKSAEMRYYYNAILFGAAYGRHYSRWAGVSLDRVILSGKHWTETDILNEYNRTVPPPPAYVVEQWDFESMPPIGSKSENVLEGNSQPKLVQGIDGNAVSFDGLDDAYRTFVKVPMDNITLSFFVRLDDPSIQSTQSIATLYGMYNTTLNLVWRPRSFMLQSKLENTPLETPAKTVESPLNLPAGACLHLQDDELCALTPSAEIWMEGPLGWQKHADPSPSIKLPVGRPWLERDRLNCLDAAGTQWSWQANEGWTEHGHEQWEGSKILESSRFGAFVSHDAGWLWFEESGEKSWVPQDSIAAPTMFSWTPVGDMVHLGAAGWFGWQPSRRNLTMMLARPLISPNGMQSRMLWVLGILMLIIVGGIWTIRRTSNLLDTAMDEGLTVPSDLLQTLGRLVALGQVGFDTVTLDDAIGNSDYDTDETRRARRSRFVKDCNSWGHSVRGMEIIQRTKDPYDRRRTNYQIHLAWFSDLQTLVMQTSADGPSETQIADPKEGHGSEA